MRRTMTGRSIGAAIAALAVAGCGKSAEHAPAALTAPAAPSVSAQALLAELPPAYAHADLHNGELHFHLCLSCHTIDKDGPDMTGPNLYGVFGRQNASRPGFAYSAALKAKNWRWDVAHLDGWLKDPRAYLPGTKMTFYGLRDDDDRRDTIAYLKVVSSGGGL